MWTATSLRLSLLAAALVLLLVACNPTGTSTVPSTPINTPEPTPNIQATIEAAIKAALPSPTTSPTIDRRSTVAAAVKATIQAMPTATSIPTPQATLAPTPTPVPTPTATATPLPTATPSPSPAPTATATVTPVPTPTPSPTPLATVTPTATFAEEHGLSVATNAGLTLYYAPRTTAVIQVEWVLETYQRTLEILGPLFGVTSLATTGYLPRPETYAEKFETHGGSHPEWTQGFALSSVGEFYVNMAPVVMWDESVLERDRVVWLGEHVQEITTTTTAHELTHVALGSSELPRWLDEGVAEYVDALFAPDESVTRQLWQRRYRVRDAIIHDLVPVEKLLSADWTAAAEDPEKFSLLYKISALIVRFVSDTSGDEGLRALVESKDLGVPVGIFIDVDLREWLSQMLPEETAAQVLCGLNRARSEINQITSDWNANEDIQPSDYASFKERIQLALDSINGLTPGSIADAARLDYMKSLSDWIAAIDSYVQGDYSRGNDHLNSSNAFNNSAYDFFSSAWDEYVVTSCTLIEQQLP